MKGSYYKLYQCANPQGKCTKQRPAADAHRQFSLDVECFLKAQAKSDMCGPAEGLPGLGVRCCRTGVAGSLTRTFPRKTATRARLPARDERPARVPEQ